MKSQRSLNVQNYNISGTLSLERTILIRSLSLCSSFSGKLEQIFPQNWKRLLRRHAIATVGDIIMMYERKLNVTKEVQISFQSHVKIMQQAIHCNNLLVYEKTPLHAHMGVSGFSLWPPIKDILQFSCMLYIRFIINISFYYISNQYSYKLPIKFAPLPLFEL